MCYTKQNGCSNKRLALFISLKIFIVNEKFFVSIPSSINSRFMANNVPHYVGMFFCNVAYKINQIPLKNQVINAEHRYDDVGLRSDSLSREWQRQKMKKQCTRKSGLSIPLISSFGYSVKYFVEYSIIR